eukprot:5453716-Pyramimonas_sp.AAC.1
MGPASCPGASLLETIGALAGMFLRSPGAPGLPSGGEPSGVGPKTCAALERRRGAQPANLS